MSFDGKTAVITGASRGIGAAVARALHERGANVGLASRSGDDLGRDPAALKRLCDETADRFGGIDILVASAGIGAYAPVHELRTDWLEEIIDVNLKGTIYAVRAALPHMFGREGDIVAVGSVAGLRG